MKILLIDKNLVNRVNYRKWQALAKQPNVELVAITPDRWIENYETLHPPLDQNFGFPVIPLKVFWPGYENRGFYLGGLNRIMKSVSPDVIIVFEEPFSIFAFQAWIAAKRGCPRAKIVLYTYDNLSQGRKYPYRPSFFYKMIERWLMPRIDLLLAANQEAVDWHRRVFSTKVQKVYFGVDTQAFVSGQELGSIKNNSGVFNVAYIGRILVDKGLNTLIDAIALMPKTIHLLLLGNGRDFEYLVSKVRTLELTERVVFHQSVPSFEIRDFFSSIDVLVLPSKTMPLWKEQYGRVLVEAMAGGVPVIGSSSGAIPEIIGDAGLIFPEGDANELAACIGKLMSDPALRMKYALAGKKRATMFSAEKFAEIVYELLASIIDTKTN